MRRVDERELGVAAQRGTSTRQALSKPRANGRSAANFKYKKGQAATLLSRPAPFLASAHAARRAPLLDKPTQFVRL